MKRNLSLAIVMLAGLWACGSDGGHDKAMLKAAYELQKEAIAELKSIEEVLDAGTVANADSIHDLLHEMEESIVEIPGHELQLPGHEGHDHSHERLELSDQEIFDLQKELLAQLQKIKKSISNND